MVPNRLAMIPPPLHWGRQGGNRIHPFHCAYLTKYLFELTLAMHQIPFVAVNLDFAETELV